MVNLITEVDVFHGTSDWLNSWDSTSPSTPVSVSTGQAPELDPTVPGDFYYRNMPFRPFALSLVVCCGMFGVYTAKDTAQVLSQRQQHPPLERNITAADVKGVLRKIVLENSNGYQTLKAAGRESSLVRGILAPMVAAGYVPMHENGDPPTWYPRFSGPKPPRLPRVLIRRRFPADDDEDVDPMDSTPVPPKPVVRVTYTTADEKFVQDLPLKLLPSLPRIQKKIRGLEPDFSVRIVEKKQ